MHLKYIVLLVGLISMFFASLPKYKFRYGLETAWLIIFAFLAIRYDFGNDYMPYLNGYNEINNLSVFSIDKEAHFESGWQLLCRLFKPLGFSVMVMVLSAFECFIFYRFIKQYVPEKYSWFAIFIYVFNPSLMLLGASMMRQMLAIAIFVWSFKYIRERRLLPFILLITIATQFHSSAIVLYPFYLLGYLDKIEFSWRVSVGILVAYIMLSTLSANMQFGGVVEGIVEVVGEEEALEYYTDTQDVSKMHVGNNTGMGTIIMYLIFGYLVITIGQYPKYSRIMFLLLILGTFVRPLANTLHALGRFVYYFSIFQVVCYPILLFCAVEDRRNAKIDTFTLSQAIRMIVLLCIIVTTIRGYIGFFNSPIWVEKFSKYHTIFEVI